MPRFLPLLPVAALVLAACSTPYGTPVFAARDGGATTFLGVADLLRRDRPLDVLFVHGMCTHDANWAREALQGLYTALGGNPEDVKPEPVVVAGTSIMLYQQTLQVAGGKIRANALLWSPLTTPLKGQLCYDQTNKAPTCPPGEKAKTYPYRRATLNRILKDTILDDCLADAVIYQGKSRDDINAQMQNAILQASATSGGATSNHAAAAAAVPQSVPLVVISESLGSKVAFDAIYKLSTNPGTAAAGQRTFNRTMQIFMSANQLPILALADRTLDGTVAPQRESGYPENPIGALIKRRQLNLLDAQPGRIPQVVAFTDPNDLLSFTLVSSPYAEEYPVVDVVVSNDTTYLGVAELPTTAHLGYRGNAWVRKLIACGNPTSGMCKK